MHHLENEVSRIDMLDRQKFFDLIQKAKTELSQSLMHEAKLNDSIKQAIIDIIGDDEKACTSTYNLNSLPRMAQIDPEKLEWSLLNLTESLFIIVTNLSEILQPTLISIKGQKVKLPPEIPPALQKSIETTTLQLLELLKKILTYNDKEKSNSYLKCWDKDDYANDERFLLHMTCALDAIKLALQSDRLRNTKGTSNWTMIARNLTWLLLENFTKLLEKNPGYAKEALIVAYGRKKGEALVSEDKAELSALLGRHPKLLKVIAGNRFFKSELEKCGLFGVIKECSEKLSQSVIGLFSRFSKAKSGKPVISTKKSSLSMDRT